MTKITDHEHGYFLSNARDGCEHPECVAYRRGYQAGQQTRPIIPPNEADALMGLRELLRAVEDDRDKIKATLIRERAERR